MIEDRIFWAFFAGIFGAMWGSFCVAQVWRIRARQLSNYESELSKNERLEFEKIKLLAQEKISSDRSRCLSCGYRLRAWDLVPIFSWIFLGGKCRRCKKPIGWMEFLAEVGVSAIFSIVMFFAVSKGWGAFEIMALFLAFLPLVVLFLYDAKFSLLPTKILYGFVVMATIFFVVSNFSNLGEISTWLKVGVSILSFPAVYWALAFFSKEKLVGDGDWILALGLILLLPIHPTNGVMMMFFSNIFALVGILVLSVFRKQKIGRGVRVPFGPAMILAALFLLAFADRVVYIFAI